jgi:RND family efflux transporter MFP subunit
MVPPGRSVIVSAPVAGTVQPPPGGSPPAAGGAVAKGQVVYALLPLLTTEARTTLTTALVDAEGLVRSAEVQLGAAETNLTRAKQLQSESAGTKRSVDDAQAQYDLAQKGLEAARARREVLAKATQGGGGAGSVAPLEITSPDAGVLRNVQAAPGQMVSAGAMMFEVINTAKVWVRVPVYAGDAGDVAADEPASVGPLGGARGTGPTGGGTSATKPATPAADAWPRPAKPVAAPPSADALGSTVDLFYELDNAGGLLKPGQRVAATVPLRGEEASLVVPWSAVVYDVHGGAWVYATVGPHAYSRRRVEVRHVADGAAVLAAGPPEGTAVVTQGVAEMFGNEMGFAK